VIVDSHVHVVSPDEARYPLNPTELSGPWYREAPCSAELLLERMAEAGVARAVLVQPIGAYTHDCSYAADSVERYADRFAGVCSVDPNGSDPVAALDHWVRERGMRGVRLLALSRGASWLAEPRTWPLWERAAKLGARVVVTLFAHQLPELDTVLRRFPDVLVALDHCGFPELTGEPWREVEPLLALAERANLHLKISSFVLEAAEKAGDPRSFVKKLVAAFGAERVMWGSDFSQTHDRPYPGLVALGRHAFSGLGADQGRRCLGGSAERLFF
jgi:predicted TIM-barrel fold metal-dependent hydrolase